MSYFFPHMNSSVRKFRVLCFISGSLGIIQYSIITFFLFSLYANYDGKLWIHNIMWDNEPVEILLQIIIPPSFSILACTVIIFSIKLIMYGIKLSSIEKIEKNNTIQKLIYYILFLFSVYICALGFFIFVPIFSGLIISDNDIYHGISIYIVNVITQGGIFFILFGIPGTLLFWTREVCKHLLGKQTN